jgi:hypothetical protein
MRSINNAPDTRFAFDMAHRFIQEKNIRWLPVDALDIITSLPNCTMKYVKDLAFETHMTESHILKFILHGEDGLARYIPTTGQYEIIINSEAEPLGRVLWTMIHEVGHIYLKHLSDFNQTSITKGHLSDEIYEALEFESNIFAGEVLASKWLMRHLGINSQDDILTLCGLSFTGAKSRLKKVNEKATFPPIGVNITISNFSTYAKDITLCRPIDGFNSPTFATSNNPQSLLKIPMPSFIKPGSCCLFCGSTHEIYGSKYCIMCGNKLPCGGYTSEDHCEHINLPFAAFCSQCGNQVYKTKQGFCLEEFEAE